MELLPIPSHQITANLDLQSLFSFNSTKSHTSNIDDRQEQNFIIYDKLTSSAFAAILENAASSLSILGNIMHIPTLDHRDIISKNFFLPYQERNSYSKTQKNCKNTSDNDRKVKFQNDRTLLEKILREACLEMLKGKCFNKLMRRITEFDKAVQEENNFLETTETIKLKQAFLQRNIDDDKMTSIRNIQLASENLGILKDEYQRISFENEIKLNYVKKWEESSYESNYIELDIKEDEYIKYTQEKNNTIDREVRIHAEIETVLSETILEYENSIHHWIDTYHKEMEKLEVDIQILIGKREQQIENTLSQEYNKRTSAITDYLKVRKQRRKEQQFLQRKQQAATKIQSWWRGVMVRKCLGPYRKKKSKKGKGDKKGKRK